MASLALKQRLGFPAGTDEEAPLRMMSIAALYAREDKSEKVSESLSWKIDAACIAGFETERNAWSFTGGSASVAWFSSLLLYKETNF